MAKDKMDKAVFGVYRNSNEINLAVQGLQRMGFDRDDIVSLQLVPRITPDFSRQERRQILPGMMIGAILGGVVFGIISMLVAFGVIPITGFNVTSIFGRVILTVTGCLLGAIVIGAGGALVGIGTPEPAADRYGDYVKEGGILLSVKVAAYDSLVASDILEATGGQDIKLLNADECWRRVYSKAAY